jgi:hypothetical protein
MFSKLIIFAAATVSAVPQPISYSIPQSYVISPLPAYASPPSLPAYGSSGQSNTIGGQINQFQNSQSSGSSLIGGFSSQGINGNQFEDHQISTGGSSTTSSSQNSQSYNGGSSFSKPASNPIHY